MFFPGKCEWTKKAKKNRISGSSGREQQKISRQKKKTEGEGKTKRKGGCGRKNEKKRPDMIEAGVVQVGRKNTGEGRRKVLGGNFGVVTGGESSGGKLVGVGRDRLKRG